MSLNLHWGQKTSMTLYMSQGESDPQNTDCDTCGSDGQMSTASGTSSKTKSSQDSTTDGEEIMHIKLSLLQDIDSIVGSMSPPPEGVYIDCWRQQ